MKFILATTLFLASVMALPSQLAAAPHDGGKRDLVKESREAANEFCSGFLGRSQNHPAFSKLLLHIMINDTDDGGFEQDIAPIPSSAAITASAHDAQGILPP